jgi:phosphatidylserine/phosphatidylglycerophosphate/cardiolipin synthase-like enzyme
MSSLEDLAIKAVTELGSAGVRTLADRLAAGWPEQAILGGTTARQGDAVRSIVAASTRDSTSASEVAAMLRGVAAAYAHRAGQVQTEMVWSGPASHAVPVRSTAQALIEVAGEASSELVLMTYSARRHEPINSALSGAVSRGVSVTVVVETLQGAGSALGGAEPAAAFAGVSGVDLWHWPVVERAGSGARMHAKLAVADSRVLLVSSANLTMAGVTHNIEAGVLVRGGAAPARAAEHIAELRSKGVLQPLRVGSN